MGTSGNQGSLFGVPDGIEPDEPVDPWYIERGFRLIAGVDEAGRGALAGPVCAAAVILGDARIDGLNDSKKLKPDVRVRLTEEIWMKARGVGVAMVGPAMIDSINILRAAMEAMRLAVRMLPISPEIVLVDGNQLPSGIDNGVAIVKGDTKSQAIMAAGIIAKVTRDAYMIRAARQFPDFMFEVHKGYAVRAHFNALEKHGPTDIHRLSFEPCGRFL